MHFLGEGIGLSARIPYFAAVRNYSELPNFFLNLLPEGARLQLLLDASRSREDTLDLLLRVGWDAIGDVAVMGTKDPSPRTPMVAEVSLHEAKFWALFERGAQYNADASVPGVQQKISASTIAFGVRMNEQLSGIVKLNPKDFPRLVHNEDFFLRMAKGCGLDVAEAKLVTDAAGETGLLVTRFDRVKEGRDVHKLHQEDGCQLLDLAPSQKYRVSVRQIADSIVEFASAPRVEILRLLEQVLFNYLIGNGDQHAKNVSLLWRKDIVRLSPAYDVLSTLPYPDLNQKMAMSLDGKTSNLKSADFVRFGERFEVPAAATSAMIRRVTTKAKPWLDRLDEIGFEDRITQELRRIIELRLVRF